MNLVKIFQMLSWNKLVRASSVALQKGQMSTFRKEGSIGCSNEAEVEFKDILVPSYQESIV